MLNGELSSGANIIPSISKDVKGKVSQTPSITLAFNNQIDTNSFTKTNFTLSPNPTGVVIKDIVFDPNDKTKCTVSFLG